MWKQILTKKYWLSVTIHFLFFLVIYSLLMYAFAEDRKTYWDFPAFFSRINYAFFMGLMFAFRDRVSLRPEAKNSSEFVNTRWTLKDFFNLLGLVLIVSFLIISLLFISIWLILHFFFYSQEPFETNYLKIIFTTMIMSVVAVILMFLSDLFLVRLQRRT